MEKFATRLKELRTEKGVSQQQVADVVRMSKMSVSHWESGHSEPSIPQLILLSEFFGVTVDYLVGKVDFYN